MDKSLPEGKFRRRTTLNPFILQELFTNSKRLEKDVEFAVQVVKEILQTGKGYMERTELRNDIAKKVADITGLKGKDVSKLLNDLMRAGILVGATVEGDTVRIASASLGYRAKHLVLSSHAGSLAGSETLDARLEIIAKSYAGNTIVSKILEAVLNEAGNQETLDLKRLTGIASKAVRSLVESGEIAGFSGELERELKLIAELLENDEKTQENFFKGVIVPLSLLTKGKAVEADAKTVRIHVEELARLLGFSLDDVARAYCSIMLRIGYRPESIGRMGPKIPIKTIAEELGVSLDTLRSFISKKAKFDKRVVYEESILLRDDLRYTVMLSRELIAKHCTQEQP